MARKDPKLRVTVDGTSPKRRSFPTEFEQRWGIHVKDLARVEGVSPQTIQMRVHNYGTPFQRRRKLTTWEERFGKTLTQLALERGVHPMSIFYRIRTYNSLDLPPECITREELRDTSWAQQADWQFNLLSTFFTLEDALQRLAELNQRESHVTG
jgi:hypothetical protein